MLRIRRHPAIPALSMIDPGGVVLGLEGFLCSYVLQAEKTALLDIGPACALPATLEGLKRLGIHPQAVDYLLISHIHLDHGGAAGAALRILPNAVALVHPAGAAHLEKPFKLWEGSRRTLGALAEAYGQPEPAPPGRVIAAQDGQVIDLGGLELEVLFTPGHAPHHFSLWDGRHRLFLAGELAGVRAHGIRRPAVPPPLYLEQQLASLDRSIALRPAVLCYGHYGWEAAAERRLRAHQRQLLLWRDIVAEGRKAGWGQERTAGECIRRDRKMVGLDALPQTQREREMAFVMNSVAGLTWHLKQALP
ncbi:MAG: MBL fold metallo-hydrolase [Chloroflexi bacterium]|nr:MBL fold metallo-hydrolase [Chloroflexota bacterium]